MPFPNQNYNLYSFRNTIKDHGRAYLFLIKIPAIAGNSNEALTCFARSTNLPAYSIQNTQIAFQGMQYNVATVPTFEPWSVNFLCDEAHTLRHRFLGWQQTIFDAQRQVAGSPLNYKADNITVSQLGRAGNVITTYKFIGAYPNNVGQVELNHGTLEPEAFDVQFTYDYFVVGEGNALSASVDGFIKLDSGFNFGASMSVGGANLGVGIGSDGNVNVSLGGNIGINF